MATIAAVVLVVVAAIVVGIATIASGGLLLAAGVALFVGAMGAAGAEIGGYVLIALRDAITASTDAFSSGSVLCRYRYKRT